jgi:hypothetical protein
MLPIKLHARRKFLERHMNNKSAMAQQVLEFFGELCEIEWEVRALGNSPTKAVLAPDPGAQQHPT